MVEVVNLFKSFEKKVLFERFNVSIRSGEFVVFSGESGCGKTTLLNMIGAIEPFDDGKIEVNGLDVKKSKNRLKLFRESYGFIFQNFALVENKTVKENLSFVMKKYSSGVSIEEALRFVELHDFENEKVYKLSGGEQQRVALARLLIKKCNIILADEPTGSLDKRNADHVMDIINNLRLQGKTIVLVTHSDEIKKRGDRLIYLKK